MPYESANFIVENTENRHNLYDLLKSLNQIHGVQTVSVNGPHKLVSIDYDSSGTSYDQIEHCLNRLGYEIAADASLINTR